MPRRNRVSPFSELFADPARGLVMGNRGVLHDDAGRITARRSTTRAWICCLLSFKNRRRPLMQPGRYTELFFLDEAVAYAAGHRPCAECRRADYRTFRALWEDVHGPVGTVRDIDARLHEARIDPSTGGQRRIPVADWSALPDGTFVQPAGSPEACLVLGGRLLVWHPAGYRTSDHGPGPAEILTPAPIVELFAAGLCPALHPSAGA